MITKVLLICSLIASTFAASLPLQPLSIFQPPMLNLTLLSSPGSETGHSLNVGPEWPSTPFERHLESYTNIEVLDCAPSDPTAQSTIVGDIRLIENKVRTQGTRLAMMKDYHGMSGNVDFLFHATGYNFFRGSEIALVVDMIAEMTNLYGAADLYGRLVNTGVVIAYFQLSIRVGA